jgi:hypothetical protein|tara:strand:- start:623 stop:3178 length:2556 start_codon:yes stop_codon:yes gene_type:complete
MNVLQRKMFANGGMAQAQPPMMQQPMAPPPMAPPTSVGKGITSGLVDPAQEQMIAEQGFAEMAGGMQNMLSNIDSAGSTEEVINAMRGDEASLQERYSELADIVGEGDAKKTPESVLALVQPTFTMMDLVQEEAPAGGIADAMPKAGGGLLAGNIDAASPVQAPGMGEAMARMQAGETPVKAKFGGSQNDLIARPDIRIPPRVTQNIQPISMSLPNLGGQALPGLQSMDQSRVQRYAGDYMGAMKPYLDQLTGGSGPDVKQSMEILEPYMPKQRSSAEVLQEYQDLLGSGDMDAAKTQAYLALVQAGQSISESGKPLLGAAIDAAGEAAPTLSKIASEKAAQDRAIKLASRQEQVQREDAIRSAQLGVAQNAIARTAGASASIENAILSAQQKAIDYGLKMEGDAVKVVNDTAIRNWSAANQYGVTATETWGRYNEATKKVDILGVRRTADGVKYIDDNNGTLVDVPKGYAPYNKDAFAAAHGTGAIDFSKAKKVNLLIPDITVTDAEGNVTEARGSKSGFNQFAGFFVGGNYYYSPTGDVKDAVKAPQGFIEGAEKDVLEISQPDGAGRIKVTVKAGPNAGDSFISTINGKVFPGVAYELDPAVRDDSGAYQSGNPLVTTVPNPGVSVDRMSAARVNSLQDKVIAQTQAITAANSVLSAIGDAVGPLNTVKAFTSNFVAPLAPDFMSGALEFSATERGRREMELFGRNLARALALSDRYAVREQELIAQLNEDPVGFFKNPDMSTVRFQELMRYLQNDLTFNRGILDDKNEIGFLNRVPTGTANDPIIFEAPGQFDYLSITAQNAGGADKLNGMFIRMTAAEARRQGIDQNLIPANGSDLMLEIGKDINF